MTQIKERMIKFCFTNTHWTKRPLKFEWDATVALSLLRKHGADQMAVCPPLFKQTVPSDSLAVFRELSPLFVQHSGPSLVGQQYIRHFDASLSIYQSGRERTISSHHTSALTSCLQVRVNVDKKKKKTKTKNNDLTKLKLVIKPWQPHIPYRLKWISLTKINISVFLQELLIHLIKYNLFFFLRNSCLVCFSV